MLPAPTSRLFPDGEVKELTDENRPLVICRLLEDGDARDLRWLFEGTGERHVSSWFRERGGRALSRRSRSFWRLVLDTEPSPPRALTPELWPL